MLSNSWRALLFNLEHKSEKKRIISGLSQFLCLISLAFISIIFVRKKGKVNSEYFVCGNSQKRQMYMELMSMSSALSCSLGIYVLLDI